jgi:uncharacterized protein (TIGR02588 family)
MSQTHVSSSKQPEPKSRRSFAEWISFGIATLILVAIAGLVIFDWLTTKQQPPILVVTHNNSVRAAQGQFYVPFTVSNLGGSTAESVQVVASLQIHEKVKESGDQQIDFLAGGEKEEGAFIFSHDPRRGQLILRVASYKLP